MAETLVSRSRQRPPILVLLSGLPAGVDRIGGAAGIGVQTPCWVLKKRAPCGPFFWTNPALWRYCPRIGVCRPQRVWGWPLFENCTVDASIAGT
jgi:hypothetical protein